MAAETAGGAFHEGAGDAGDPGKQQQVLVPEEIRRNGVHADAGIGDGGESFDFSHPLREGLEEEEEEEEEEKYSQGGGGGGATAAAAADHHAKTNGDHHLAAQDGEALEVSEDRVASVVDEVREEDEGGGGGGGGRNSSVQGARQGSEVVEQEEEAVAPPKLGLLQSHDEVPQPQHQPASEGELLPNASEGAETISDSKAAAEEYPQRDLALSSTAAARSVEFPQTSEEDEEEKISSSRSKPQAGTVQAVESATRLEKVDPEEEEEAAAAVELSSSSAALPLPNAGPALGRTATKRGKKGPSDEELKKMVMIPEYLAKDIANAIQSAGAAYPDGPPFGDKIEAPPCPLLVFVNSKSGGRLGPALTQHLSDLISPNQVYDLSSTKPTDVIRYGIGCLDKLATSGDECARLIRSNLRIIVAGGDGTVGWVLSCLGELQISSPSGIIPPVGIIPLGTGNDLSRSFGWGGGFSSASKGALRKLLIKTLAASVAPVDTWQVVVKPTAVISSTDIQFPHALHPQHHVPLPRTVSGTKDQKDENDSCFEGLFWNYFSIGMDAQVAYGFHHLRDEKPWLARGRVTNQMIYSGYGCTQGWFCTACSAAPRARGIHNIVRLQIKRPGSSTHDWEDIEIPHNIRAIVVLNLQSYAGGRKPWGHPSENTMKKEGFVEAKSDDGLLEIVGFRDGWHTAFVMISVLTAVRLCQAKAVRLELRGNRPRGYMQMDGEPWKQPLGRVNEPATLVEINKVSTPSILLKR